MHEDTGDYSKENESLESEGSLHHGVLLVQDLESSKKSCQLQELRKSSNTRQSDQRVEAVGLNLYHFVERSYSDGIDEEPAGYVVLANFCSSVDKLEIVVKLHGIETDDDVTEEQRVANIVKQAPSVDSSLLFFRRKVAVLFEKCKMQRS